MHHLSLWETDIPVPYISTFSVMVFFFHFLFFFRVLLPLFQKKSVWGKIVNSQAVVDTDDNQIATHAYGSADHVLAVEIAQGPTASMKAVEVQILSVYLGR